MLVCLAWTNFFYPIFLSKLQEIPQFASILHVSAVLGTILAAQPAFLAEKINESGNSNLRNNGNVMVGVTDGDGYP